MDISQREAFSQTEMALSGEYFANNISMEYPGINAGLSYVARIETVEVVEKWGELLQVIKSIRGKNWLIKHENILEPIHNNWNWPEKRSFLFLCKPRLVFNPPIKKHYLQRGTGFFSKKYLSFDKLFAARDGENSNT